MVGAPVLGGEPYASRGARRARGEGLRNLPSGKALFPYSILTLIQLTDEAVAV